MKKSIFIIMLTAFAIGAKAQTKDSVKLYNPAADARAEINEAVKRRLRNIRMCCCKLAVTGVNGA